ncbi:MAG: bi-domain-containing oxidoreductase [Candidatus Margulisiibacteriota bacterium]|jgi:predicted dehydrogenase/threonine dehydrogenase-like Zn-dependent dehydrogenase
MKQVVQSFKTGELNLVDVPAPQVKAGGVLIKTTRSAVSVGTEKLIVNLAQQNLVGKALSRPDLVRRLIDKAKTEGIMEAYQAVKGRMETQQPLGYSSAGEVLAVGAGVDEFKIGDRVACGSDLFATHSEITWVPKNDCVKIPDGVSDEDAAFAYIAAVAIHAIRSADLTFGSKVAVIGLGLLGQISVQVLKAWGCDAFGFDLDAKKVALAVELGAKGGLTDRQAFATKAKLLTDGHGFDATIIMASTSSNDPLELAAEITREKGKIVACGLVKLEVPRNVFFEKELSLIVSRATGPGKFDPDWELKGHNYPLGLVRWTQAGNMKEFLSLAADKRVTMAPVITHRFNIDEALSAYELLLSKEHPYYLGVLLQYKDSPAQEKKIAVTAPKGDYQPGQPVVGLIGAGLFSNVTILPCLKKIKGLALRGVATATGLSGRNVANQYGFEYCTTDYKEILSDKKINAVIIATRHDLHAGMIVEALAAGKDVFVEKPLALNPTELKEVGAAYRESGKRLMVGFNRRFAPSATRAKALMGEIGAVTVNCRVNAGFVPKSHWTLNKEGGGRVIGEVCHFIDSIQYATSSLPVRVFAETISSANDQVTNEDNIAITIKMKNGSVATLLYTSVGHKGIPRERLEVFGNNQSYVLDNFVGLEFVRDGKKEKTKKFNIDRGHQKEFEEFFDALKNGRPLPVDFSEYVYTTLATFAVMESIKSGRPVEIADL